MANLSILIVDDEQIQRETLANILSEHAYRVETAENPDKAFELISQRPFDILISDFRMPGGSGIDLAKKVLSRWPETLTLIMTAYADVESILEAMRAGVADYLIKPLQVDNLLQKLRIFNERKELLDEVHRLRIEVNTSKPQNRLFGDSRLINEVRSLITQVASTKSTVLITGESGTGKEVAARQIHVESANSQKPFIALNCGAIPENLLESELFGHKKGSFTGANEDKKGLFIAAHGGTVFLDEIGDLPKNLQVKLLRVLQEKEVTPLGTTTPVKVDVRVITATNRDLSADVESGHFRKDLFYRINVVEIKMPSLRERREDIPLLARLILKKLSTEMSRPVRDLSNEALRVLMDYPWPGNVRELENILERALILKRQGDVIQVSDLPDNVKVSSDVQATDLNEAIQVFTRIHIAKILKSVDGDKKKAAQILGLGLSSLYRKIEELEIQA